MSRADLFAAAVERLRAAGIDNPRLEARLLLEHAEKLCPIEETTHPPLEGGSKNPRGFFGEGAGVEAENPSPKFAAQISTLPQGEGEVCDQLDVLLARRVAREPLAYILGRKEFWSLDFAVGPGVLVPRPESETLIEAARVRFADPAAPLRILDLGCGSGCLIVTALTLWPRAQGVALDLSPIALAWTERNAAQHGVAERLTLVEGPFAAAPAGPFDLILSNPPYLTAAELSATAPELHYEPALALVAGADGLDAYRALAPVLACRLAAHGAAIIELGAGQGAAVTDIFCAAGLAIADARSDLSSIPRALTITYTVS